MRSHPIFRREGDNLYQELALEFVDAILGTDIRYAAPAMHQAHVQALTCCTRHAPGLHTGCSSICKLPAGSAPRTHQSVYQETVAAYACSRHFWPDAGPIQWP